MKIPALVWLMLGIVLSASSYYLGDDFVLFFYAGLIIIALGVFKLILEYVFSSKETSIEKKAVQEKEHYDKCRHCNNVVRRIDYYCSMCGKQLR
ncbi:hypothetical protein JW851_02495 [Candidatus Woesearchaeota archaeon]|nr:hypothetical protein [Candidatus Woesearchaeota archaeon]